MSHFWCSLFEHLKGCGQNATLFLVALAGFVGLLVAAAIILNTQLRQYFMAALPWLGVLLAAWGGLAIRRARARRRERLLQSPMSEDEVSKARSKLVRSRNPR
jgi:peptidoglycan/LPS O-acetylase OafA/YrhL